MESKVDFEFSGKILARMVTDGVISLSPTGEDKIFISRLRRIWTDEWYVAQMCKRFRPEKRAVMLAFPDFDKIERYILNSYLNPEPGVKLPVTTVVENIDRFLGVKNYDKNNIKRIRQIAYNILRGSRRKMKKHIMLEVALLQNPAFFEA
ncbi:MAG: hypothetical protein WCP19_13340 [Chloroflexota bacterium]